MPEINGSMSVRIDISPVILTLYVIPNRSGYVRQFELNGDVSHLVNPGGARGWPQSFAPLGFANL